MKGRQTETTSSGPPFPNSMDGASVQHDLSILRKPIQTSITGFSEVMKAYTNGTEEVVLILSFTYFRKINLYANGVLNSLDKRSSQP